MPTTSASSRMASGSSGRCLPELCRRRDLQLPLQSARCLWTTSCRTGCGVVVAAGTEGPEGEPTQGAEGSRAAVMLPHALRRWRPPATPQPAHAAAEGDIPSSQQALRRVEAQVVEVDVEWDFLFVRPGPRRRGSPQIVRKTPENIRRVPTLLNSMNARLTRDRRGLQRSSILANRPRIALVKRRSSVRIR